MRGAFVAKRTCRSGERNRQDAEKGGVPAGKQGQAGSGHVCTRICGEGARRRSKDEFRETRANGGGASAIRGRHQSAIFDAITGNNVSRYKSIYYY